MSHGNWKDMFKAVQQNNSELVTYYIQQGVDIEYQHPEYFTSALIESIRLGYNELTELLLQHGASTDIPEVYSGKTALDIAVELNNRKAIELIIRYKESKV